MEKRYTENKQIIQFDVKSNTINIIIHVYVTGSTKACWKTLPYFQYFVFKHYVYAQDDAKFNRLNGYWWVQQMGDVRDLTIIK